MPKYLSLCLIGAGRIAKVHIRSIAALGGAEITAVVDPANEAGERVAASIGARWYSDFEQACAAQVFDGAIIAAPTGLHASLIEACVRRGLPVFCEKPVDQTLERVDACLEVVEASGVPVLMAFHRRFDAARREVHDIVRSGTLGKIEHVLQISRDPRLPDESFIAHSGGMVKDMLIHDLDELTWLCGTGGVFVHADLRRFVDPPLLAKYEDFDTAAITVVFDDGPQCQLSASRRSAYGFDQRLEVFGANGMVTCPNVHTSTIISAAREGFCGAPLLDHFPQRYEAAYAAEMRNFLDVLNDTAKPHCTVRDARAALVLAELVIKSARTGKRVRADRL
ncbi:inositol 2-dehydrogenase (plasmid) [Paraburkholderia sp. PGU19]|uniref:Gfo/Idh/MocA family oxidoreductase n=1 Tax=Paraburkholderia sp. PGU19 TaxID=2735434 RepID=UPI0015DA096D|nr:Gfo/Idh/MocA family oxidoreductase [Paraburkholderia sp. PGU19]BCG04495.1 inositol 2-dehydrogenase [Paraburkholderia sp. PGU19]